MIKTDRIVCILIGLIFGYYFIGGQCQAQNQVYKDDTGAIIGRSSTMGGQTTYTNDIGEIVGRSSMTGNTTVYKDSSGAIVGRSNPTSAYGAPIPPRGALPPMPLPKGVYPWMLEQQ